MAPDRLQVIAGQYDDVSGPAHTFSPLNVWDLQLNQGRDLTLRQPEGWSTALVVLEGSDHQRFRVPPAKVSSPS